MKYSLFLSYIVIIFLCGFGYAFAPLGAHAASNVLTNGMFSEGATGWTVAQSGGNGCVFNGDLLATSYDWCVVYQQVDLLAAGYTAEQLDAAPDITFSTQYYQRGDKTNTKYFFEFKLLTADGVTVATSSLYGSQASPLTISSGYDTWATTTYTFSSYGSGVRYAYVRMGGDDGTPNWAGHYGPYFDNASVTLASVADTTPPAVSSLSPLDNAVLVPAASVFEIDFTETVATSTGGEIALYTSADDALVELFPVSAASITTPSSTAIRITPSVTLLSGTGYYVTITGNAIQDTSGNYYAGITASTTWNFTTADTEAPTVSIEAPASTQHAGTREVMMRVTTNEAATCVFASVSDATYNTATLFDTTGATEHTTTLSVFGDGIHYQYYVRCRDTALNESSPTLVYFSVLSGAGGSKSSASSRTHTASSQDSVLVSDTPSSQRLSESVLHESGTHIADTARTASPGAGQAHLFVRDLKRGMSGEDVYALQEFLNTHNFVLAPAGAGAPGSETRYFGTRTENALRRFQLAHAIVPPVGYFGPITRGVISRTYGIE